MKWIFLLATLLPLSSEAMNNLALRCVATSSIEDDGKLHLLVPKVLATTDEGLDHEFLMVTIGETAPNFASKLCQSCGFGSDATNLGFINLENGPGVYAFFDSEGHLVSLGHTKEPVRMVSSLSCTK